MNENKILDALTLLHALKNDVINLPENVMAAPLIEKINQIEFLIKTS